MQRPHWLVYSSRWWWVKDPKVWLLVALAVFDFSRMTAYFPSRHPEVLTWGLQLVGSLFPITVYAFMWGIAGVLMLILAFSRSWWPTAMGFVSGPPFLWGIAYTVSAYSTHSTPRDAPTSLLYWAMGVVYLSAVLIPPEGGWRRKVSLSKTAGGAFYVLHRKRRRPVGDAIRRD